MRALCHDTVQCIVTKCKMGSSPACCLHHFFFHSIFFFILATGKPPIYIYIYFHFLVEQNKFLKIYFYLFFYFFPVLHTIKPQNFFFFNTHFFSFNSGLFCPKFLKQLVLILTLVFNKFFFLICYSPSTQFHTTYTAIHVHTPFIKCTQWMHDLTHFPLSPRYIVYLTLHPPSSQGNCFP